MASLLLELKAGAEAFAEALREGCGLGPLRWGGLEYMLCVVPSE